MAIPTFLAMTAAEIWKHKDISLPVGWLSCLFSPYGTGLSNLPEELPEGSVLILSDHTPMNCHDPQRIAAQLTDCIIRLHCTGVLLDFQRPENLQQAALAKYLSEVLPYPVAVAEGYSAALSGPVFLPPIPPSMSPHTYLSPWSGREVWLELALDGEIITLTENGAETKALPYWEIPEKGFSEETLHCHYHIETTDDRAIFTLWRTREDLAALLETVEQLGVAKTVGLYQELADVLYLSDHE